MKIVLLFILLPSCHLILPLNSSTDSGIQDDVLTMDSDVLNPDTQPSACAPGAEVHQVYHPGMVMCFGSSPLDQCSASVLCAPGWRICASGDFLARGGRLTPGRTAAWIEGCIRGENGVHRPTDGPCQCDLEVGKLEQTHWACGGGIVGESVYRNVGVMTWSKCFEVGEDGWGGFWVGQPSVMPLTAVMCCR